MITKKICVLLILLLFVFLLINVWTTCPAVDRVQTVIPSSNRDGSTEANRVRTTEASRVRTTEANRVRTTETNRVSFITYKHDYYNQQLFTITKQNYSRAEKLVLFWTPYWEEYDNWGIVIREGFKQCAFSGCVYTKDRDLLKEAHVIIFHVMAVSLSDLPEFYEGQVWALFIPESPFHSGRRLKDLDKLFHWIISYRKESDIRLVYGKLEPFSQIQQNNSRLNHRGFISWDRDSCASQGRREDYVTSLMRHLNVDVYGTCGWLLCKEEDCADVFSDYKFYLSFESSLCKDYLTPSFFRALQYGPVPVVFGKVDYEVIAPPHSYINALEYKNPEDLADYLLYLSNHTEEYNKYLEWRKKWKVVDVNWLCDLCELMHDKSVSMSFRKTKLYKWYVKEAECTWWPKVNRNK